jgi:hypothetical protein
MIFFKNYKIHNGKSPVFFEADPEAQKEEILAERTNRRKNRTKKDCRNHTEHRAEENHLIAE